MLGVYSLIELTTNVLRGFVLIKKKKQKSKQTKIHKWLYTYRLLYQEKLFNIKKINRMMNILKSMFR